MQGWEIKLLEISWSPVARHHQITSGTANLT
jgi:hypothetical protein